MHSAGIKECCQKFYRSVQSFQSCPATRSYHHNTSTAEIGEGEGRLRGPDSQGKHSARAELELGELRGLGSGSPYSVTPLLPEIRAPDPFIIQKSRQLNKRVTLNVGGARHV